MGFRLLSGFVIYHLCGLLCNVCCIRVGVVYPRGVIRGPFHTLHFGKPKDLSSEKKNTQNMPSSPLGNSQSYTTDGLS